MNKNIEEKTYHVAMYLRLSKEDGDKAESDSIANQRELIQSYLSNKPNMHLKSIRIDDGYSGVNFERPAFQAMMDDIKSGRINCVIVKDLSRMGRNYIDTGRYLEQIFPFFSVRFIAINDGIDSFNESTMDNMLIPFKNLINDAYLRDISIKIRSQFDVKRKKGEFIGSFSPYGYKKSTEHHNKLVIDEEAADTVRTIFKWKKEGMSHQGIADKLNSLGVLSPMEYKKSKGSNFKTTFKVNDKAKWTHVSVLRILKDEVYIGVISQGKRVTVNYKIKQRIEKPKEEWIRVEDVHEPIISKELFQTVQEVLLKDTRIAPNKKKVYLFSGMLICGDCGNSMVRKSAVSGEKKYVYYVCNTYKNQKKCSNHSIKEEALKETILHVIRKHIDIILSMKNILSTIDGSSVQNREINKIQELIVKNEAEWDKINRFKVSIYEDYTEGLIKKEDYADMKHIYEERSGETKAILDNLHHELEYFKNTISPESEWISRFKQYHSADILSRDLMITLIDQIQIYEENRIEIHFKYQSAFEKTLSYIKSISNKELETTSLSEVV
ncbi:MAG: recombinase family protein [Maledivibacter sp.]|nr:recombinase family protein [Maledivibacter sp.]